MYARSVTFTMAPSAVEDGIAFVRDEAFPVIRETEGCLGISLLADRETGRIITTSSWQSQEALRASQDKLRPLRERGAERMRSGAPALDEWEIASMHRTHETQPGTWVRVAWSSVPVTHVERALDFYRHTLLPQIEQLDGFTSASLLIDRSTGRGVTSVAFESREAMERTRDQADYLRETSTQEANVEFLDVGEFELVSAHLHVPELV